MTVVSQSRSLGVKLPRFLRRKEGLVKIAWAEICRWWKERKAHFGDLFPGNSVLAAAHSIKTVQICSKCDVFCGCLILCWFLFCIFFDFRMFAAWNHRAVVRALGRRNFCAPSEEYLKRNYANNEAEYNTVIGSITSQRRHYLLRDVYDDMMLDGVKPERDTFHSLIVGTMKGARMQDAFFFRDEMKSMGLVPDVALYNYLISTCGKCKNSDQAIRLLEEMKRFEVKPTGQTYICLLHACAASGRLDRVYAIVRDLTAAGLGLNKFSYAGLIIAHKNKAALSDDTTSKIIELVEQSKGWSSVDQTKDNAENVMMGISEEELYNLPTAEYIHRRGGFIAKQLTVYHVAFHACADLGDVQAIERLLEMLEKDGKTPDVFILLQVMR
ncbi:UNVERIFIED_CONTAM: Pentatricopeptide repeat-containing protein, mitochondrial [Sesamum radiatum]|uniref:Pentatricopeptide repeat-containing protein, mitochondrial n=1 Tax=Sesamum radiatum TaxID=300843 RepID=A0AAW2V474_SESRA